MTKPKAQALGVLSTPGALAWFEGELVPTLPDLSAELADAAVDHGEFGDWMRAHLARYRAATAGRAGMGQKAAVIAWLQAAEDDIGAAIADGRLRHLPAFFAEPAVSHAALKAGTTWEAAVAAADPMLVGRFVTEGRESLQRQGVSRGRPKATPRDTLLSAVVERLKGAGLSSADAQHQADLVLVACGVPSPEASVARAARRGRGPR